MTVRRENCAFWSPVIPWSFCVALWQNDVRKNEEEAAFFSQGAEAGGTNPAVNERRMSVIRHQGKLAQDESDSGSFVSLFPRSVSHCMRPSSFLLFSFDESAQRLGNFHGSSLEGVKYCDAFCRKDKEKLRWGGG